MAEQKNKLTLIHTNIEKLLKSKQKALPKNFNQTRFLQNCMVVLQDTKNIEKMEPLSVARTMLKGAFLGLDFFNKECYAIPYGTSLNFQTDYKGEKKLVKKYSIHPVKEVYAKLVREGDEYSEDVVNGIQTINFKPIPFNDKPIKGCFVVTNFKDGTMIFESMSIKEIEDVKEHYAKKDQNGNFSKAWRVSKGEMYKKTTIRRMAKHIEFDFDNEEQEIAYKDGSGFDVESSEEADWEPIEMPKEINEAKPEAKTPVKDTESPQADEMESEPVSEHSEKENVSQGVTERHIKDTELNKILELCDKHTVEAFKKRIDHNKKSIKYENEIILLTSNQYPRVIDKINKIEGKLL